MAGEAFSKEEWTPLPSRETPPPAEERQTGSELTVRSGIKEEEPGSFPLEMVVDVQETFTEEQRHNLSQKIQTMSVPEKFRLALVANREARNLLIHDPNKMIALTVLRNRKLTDTEVLRYAQRRDLSEDIIVTIARDPKWKKNYNLRLALVCNPKTPISQGLNMLSQLSEKDLKSLSRDKSISSVLSRKAHDIMKSRGPK